LQRAVYAGSKTMVARGVQFKKNIGAIAKKKKMKDYDTEAAWQRHLDKAFGALTPAQQNALYPDQNFYVEPDIVKGAAGVSAAKVETSHLMRGDSVAMKGLLARSAGVVGDTPAPVAAPKWDAPDVTGRASPGRGAGRVPDKPVADATYVAARKALRRKK
jgi:hypothetical protein